MGKTSPYAALAFICLMVAGALCSCSDPELPASTEVLIRIGGSTATAEDIDRAFEIAESAYARSTLTENPAVLREIRRGAVLRLIEEMLLMEAARSHDIRITDAEVDAAITTVKADYPEGVFERLLLEGAVSYEIWREKFKMRLLAQKIVNHLFFDEMALNPEDVAGYCGDFPQTLHTPSDATQEDAFNEKMIRCLKRKKAEKAYGDWIKTSIRNTPIEVAPGLWDKIGGLQFSINAVKPQATGRNL